MKGSYRSLLVSLTVIAALGWIPGPSDARAAVVEAKAEKKLPPVLDKAAPTSVADLKAIQDHVKTILKKVMPATVGIQIGGASGSGVIIDADGHVLTAGHVSGKPNTPCTVILPDGTRVKGKSLGRHVGIDSGLIQILDKRKWNFVEMGDSTKLKRGQWCLAIGHPGGFKPGRTPVVRLGRVLVSTVGVVKSDCTLVGGDSGGPLFDMEGKVIGIHSRIGERITENLHVPVNTYRDTWDQLVKGESLGVKLTNAAFLGIRFTRDSTGLEIIEVYEDSPAEKGGLKVGDRIVAIDGEKLADRDALASFMEKKKPGEVVSVEVLRDAAPVTVKVKLGRRPAE